VSDRKENWKENYRIPDVAVFLPGNAAEDCDTHWYGGPDFASEIASPDDRSREKLGFYSKVGVRELLLIDRDPWSLELYQARRGKLVQTGRSTVDQPKVLVSKVVPLTFCLRAGEDRPLIEIKHKDSGQCWVV